MEIACKPADLSIPVIRETLPDLDLDDSDLEDLDLDSEPDFEPPTCNGEPDELGPTEGYESCQLRFGSHMSVVELDGFEPFDGDDRDDRSISFNCSAIDGLPAHLRSPETKFHHVSNSLATIHVPWPTIPMVPQAQSVLVDKLWSC